MRSDARSQQPASSADGLESSVPTGRDVVIVAVGQFTLMALGGVLAIMIARTFGASYSTDAFFAAYGVYSIGQVVATSVRFTAIPELVGDRAAIDLHDLYGAAVVIALIVAVPAVVVAEPVGSLLVTHDPHAAATALRILWLALAGQLLSAPALAALAVESAFLTIAVIIGGSGVVSVVVFLVLRGRAGVDAAAWALAVAGGAQAFAAGIAARQGTPGLAVAGALRTIRGAAPLVMRLSWGSAGFLGPAFAYLVAIALAARSGEGSATAFSFGFVAASVLVATTTSVSALVRAPAVTADPNRAHAGAGNLTISVRATIALVTPVVALIAVAGQPLIGAMLGSAFGTARAVSVVHVIVLLLPWMLATALASFAIVELLARADRRGLVGSAVLLVALTAVLGVVGDVVLGLEGLVVGVSIAAIGVAGIQVRCAFPVQAAVVVEQTARWIMREAVLVACALLPVVVSVSVGAGTRSPFGLAACAILMAVLTAWWWPDERRAVLGAVGLQRSRAVPDSDERRS